MTSNHIAPAVARMTPPFTRETARAKVKAAENAWNSRDPEIVAQVYTENSEWRNRAEFFKGREAIKAAGYTDQQLVDISLAIAVTVFTNVFNRINDTAIDFPAVA